MARRSLGVKKSAALVSFKVKVVNYEVKAEGSATRAR